MPYLTPDIEKGNCLQPFRTWDGHFVVAVACGGWRRARPLDLALMPPTRRKLVIIRDMEG